MAKTITVGIVGPEDTQVRLETVEWDYQWIKKTVGGYIEHVTLVRDKFGMYINEEGKILDPPLPLNQIATYFYRASVGEGAPIAQMTIEGVAVLVGPPDGEGDDTDIDPEVVDMLRRLGALAE